jgi:hypothetical protein
MRLTVGAGPGRKLDGQSFTSEHFVVHREPLSQTSDARTTASLPALKWTSLRHTRQRIARTPEHLPSQLGAWLYRFQYLEVLWCTTAQEGDEPFCSPRTDKSSDGSLPISFACQQAAKLQLWHSESCCCLTGGSWASTSGALGWKLNS